MRLLLAVGASADDPRWPERQHRFLLTDFGAVGDGVTFNTRAFERAIAAVAAAGEGELRIPSHNTFLTAPFNLTSHLTLYLLGDQMLSTMLRKFMRNKSRERQIVGAHVLVISI